MKKTLYILIVCIILIVCVVVGMKYLSGESNETNISLGTSTLFSDNDINNAVSVVKKEFNKYYGCTMINLWYDEKESNKIAQSYYNVYYTDKNNIIVLFTDFETSNICPQGLSKSSQYRKYNWILVRNNQKARWKIMANGY